MDGLWWTHVGFTGTLQYKKTMQPSCKENTRVETEITPIAMSTVHVIGLNELQFNMPCFSFESSN